MSRKREGRWRLEGGACEAHALGSGWELGREHASAPASFLRLQTPAECERLSPARARPLSTQDEAGQASPGLRVSACLLTARRFFWQEISPWVHPVGDPGAADQGCGAASPSLEGTASWTSVSRRCA